MGLEIWITDVPAPQGGEQLIIVKRSGNKYQFSIKNDIGEDLVILDKEESLMAVRAALNQILER